MDRQRSTADICRKRIAVQVASGMPIRAWCRDSGVPAHGHYGCRARLGLPPAGAVGRRAALGEDPLSGHLFEFRSRSVEAKVLQGDLARKRQGESWWTGRAEGQWSASAGFPF